MRVAYTCACSITLHQHKYINDMLTPFNMVDCNMPFYPGAMERSLPFTMAQLISNLMFPSRTSLDVSSGLLYVHALLFLHRFHVFAAMSLIPRLIARLSPSVFSATWRAHIMLVSPSIILLHPLNIMRSWIPHVVTLHRLSMSLAIFFGLV
jgi:hypothetical protein